MTCTIYSSDLLIAMIAWERMKSISKRVAKYRMEIQAASDVSLSFLIRGKLKNIRIALGNSPCIEVVQKIFEFPTGDPL